MVGYVQLGMPATAILPVEEMHPTNVPLKKNNKPKNPKPTNQEKPKENKKETKPNPKPLKMHWKILPGPSSQVTSQGS